MRKAIKVSNKIEMTLPADVQFIELAAKCVSKMARMAGFGNDDAFNIELAVDEACTNVIMHAYEKDSSKIYTVICVYNQNSFTVEVQDHGKPFHFEAVPEPDVKSRIEEQKVGGLGIYLIRQIMDEVNYFEETDGLKRLVMKKYRSGRSNDK